jgi:hypothetical protein
MAIIVYAKYAGIKRKRVDYKCRNIFVKNVGAQWMKHSFILLLI